MRERHPPLALPILFVCCPLARDAAEGVKLQRGCPIESGSVSRILEYRLRLKQNPSLTVLAEMLQLNIGIIGKEHVACEEIMAAKDTKSCY